MIKSDDVDWDNIQSGRSTISDEKLSHKLDIIITTLERDRQLNWIIFTNRQKSYIIRKIFKILYDCPIV
jgi:hypothetical protein